MDAEITLCLIEKAVENQRDTIQSHIGVLIQILRPLLRQAMIMDRYIDLIFTLRDEWPERILELLVEESAHEFPRKAIFKYGLIKDILTWPNP